MVTSNTPQQSRPVERRSGQAMSFLEKVLGLLTAVLVAVTSLFGLQVKGTASDNDQLQEEIATLRETNSSLSRQVGDLKAQNKASTVQTTDETAVDAPIKRESPSGSPVSVPFKQSLDLDSEAGNWGIPDNDRSADELGYSSNLATGPSKYLNGVNGTKVALMKAEPNYSDCLGETTYVFSFAEGLVEDVWVCVQRPAGKYAKVQVAGFGVNKSTILLDILVWN